MSKHVKTLICQETGMLLTFVDYMPDGDYGALRSHPQLENIHSVIRKHGPNTAKEYIAGGILHALKDTQRLVFCDKYPATLMGEFNAALCKHNPIFLFKLYEAVQTLCYGKSLVRHCSINLASIFSSKWSIVSAIEALTGKDFGDSPAKRSVQIASRLMSDHAKPEQPKGSMNLKDIIKRMPRLIAMIANDSTDQETIESLEFEAGLSITELRRLVPIYLDIDKGVRFRMASFLEELQTLGEAECILKSATQIRSFERTIELLRDTKSKPIELDSSDSLLDLIL